MPCIHFNRLELKFQTRIMYITNIFQKSSRRRHLPISYRCHSACIAALPAFVLPASYITCFLYYLFFVLPAFCITCFFITFFVSPVLCITCFFASGSLPRRTCLLHRDQPRKTAEGNRHQTCRQQHRRHPPKGPGYIIMFYLFADSCKNDYRNGKAHRCGKAVHDP